MARKVTYEVRLVMKVDRDVWDPPDEWDWSEVIDLPDREDVISVEAKEMPDGDEQAP